MSVNYKDNDYHKVGNFTNLLVGVPKTRTVPTPQLGVEHFLWPLVTKVALMHPEWLLVGSDLSSIGEARVIEIYQGDEKIGAIRRCGYSEETRKFELTSTFVTRTMARGNSMRTKDVKKALKIIKEHFKLRPFYELVQVAVRDANSEVSQQMWQRTRKFNNVMEKLSEPIAAYIIGQMPQIASQLVEMGASTAQLSALHDVFSDLKDIKNIDDGRGNGTGLTVLLHGDEYVLVPDDRFDEMQRLKADELPDDVRSKLGVLKVVDDEVPLAGIGMRIRQNLFYLTEVE